MITFCSCDTGREKVAKRCKTEEEKVRFLQDIRKPRSGWTEDELESVPVYCKYKDSWLVAVKVDSRLEEHWRGIVYNILPLYNSNYLFYAKAISQEFEIFKDSGHALRWAMNYVDNQKSGA